MPNQPQTRMYLVTFSYIRSSCPPHPIAHTPQISLTVCFLILSYFLATICSKTMSKSHYDKKSPPLKNILLVHFIVPIRYATLKCHIKFFPLGSLGLKIKVCIFLPLLLTFHLPNSPHEIFVSHPVFLCEARFALPSRALWRPFDQASFAYVTYVCELVNYAVMNQPSVFSSS